MKTEKISRARSANCSPPKKHVFTNAPVFRTKVPVTKTVALAGDHLAQKISAGYFSS